MTAKTFSHDLNRGLGSAIIELQTNPNRMQYKDIVLRCCLKDIGYDTQSEGTKGYYLYTAIRALGVKDEFEDKIIVAFMKRLDHRLFQQLADIICLYADDGSEKAKTALRKKYQVLVDQLSKQRTFHHKFCEREQLEYLMICNVNTYKWSAFRKCIADAGHILLKRRDDACNYYDWFLSHCEGIFGKERIAQYFNTASETSAEINAFVTAQNELKKVRKNHSSKRVEQEITLENYVDKAIEIENDEHTSVNKNTYASMALSTIRFSRQATKEDLLKLVSIIKNEKSDKIRANLLHVFRRVDFPADIYSLIEYTESDCEQLQNIAIDALGRFKDQRVHDLAIKLISAGNVEAGLPLLKENWSKKDGPLIREHILPLKKISHAVQMDIAGIYSKHSSKSCGDILEHIYRNGECTFCRWGIVEALWKSRVLKEHILNECLYDSYYETQKLATRIKRKLERDVNICF